jgi:hypothetical protein
MAAALQQRENGFHSQHDSDWFLQHLVELVNSTDGFGFGITLLVDGFLVSGTLVSGKKYFSGFTKDFAQGLSDGGGDGKQAKELFAGFSKIYDTKVAAGDPNNPGPSYLHLADAHFYETSDRPVPANRGVWWRGRLSCVSGFTLGTLTVEN